MKLAKKDYELAALAGFLTGICLIPTLVNIEFGHKSLFILLPFVLAVLWAIGLWIALIISKLIRSIWQIAKFAEIGVLNTAINFGILNLMSYASGVTAGVKVGWYNVPATIIAATNSYFWNKFWVFHKVDKKGIFHDVPKFVIVTILGLVVNSLIIVAFTSGIKPQFGLDSARWLNIGKVLATLIGVLTDFLGYKFLVFVKKK